MTLWRTAHGLRATVHDGVGLLGVRQRGGAADRLLPALSRTGGAADGMNP